MGERHPCSAPIEAPVGADRLDNHHLGKVLAREEAYEGIPPEFVTARATACSPWSCSSTASSGVALRTVSIGARIKAVIAPGGM